MNLRKSVRLACLLLVILAALASRSAGASSVASVKCGGWGIVPSPNPPGITDMLSAVTAVSADNVWAVGGDGPSALIEHWDGARWLAVSNPNTGSSQLFGVAAVSANDIWAVGDSQGATQTLIEHWDGTQWSLVPSPSVGTYSNSLVSVAAVSSQDVWAVGTDQLNVNAFYRTLIEHWNGTQWSIVKSPKGGKVNRFLDGVTAVSSHDVWTVGSYAARRNQGGVLVEHWDGTKWSIIPAAGGNQSYLNATVALSSQDVWAVGRSGTASVMAERWNGQHWRRVPSPDPGDGIPFSVAAHSQKDAWMVGQALNFQQGLFITMTEHWDGTSWQVVASPNVPSENNYLYGVAAVPASHAFWAVGDAQNPQSSVFTTLIEYYC